jgi:hypothetical protein
MCPDVDGFMALQLVKSIYTSCAEARKIKIAPRDSKCQNRAL